MPLVASCSRLALIAGALLLAAACSGDDPLAPAGPGSAWAATSPVAINGATSFDTELSLARRARIGVVVYALGSAPASAPDAGSVRTAALAGTAVGAMRATTREVSADGVRRITIDSLTAGAQYVAYLVATPIDGDPAVTDSSTVVELRGTLAVRQASTTFQASSVNAAIGYLWYAPESYRKSSTEQTPLLVFLHGSGEKGNGTTELNRVRVHGPPRLVHEGREFPFIVVSPQLPTSQGGWSSGLVKQLIDTLQSRFRVDASRIYVTGLSLGAMGTWSFALAHPTVAAAVVPIAGSGNPGSACNMRNVPVWAFHGDNDGTVNISGSRSMIDALNACVPQPGETPRFTVYAGVGHDSWTRTYSGSAGHDVYAWLLTHRRAAP
ncbi:MAG: dienelactone hydrolase family protein [Gemmatimonadaceae bacterium]|nr:dienelactone hydrolase family protein [Gemmatimonadaceae bacterium]